MLIRHGQSESNLNNFFAGQTDVPLTEQGRKQGIATGEFLKNEHVDAVYSSDLSRAYDTACYAAEHHGLEVVKSTGLREICGGRWEGRSYPDIKETFPETYNTWVTNIGLTACEDGECVQQVGERFYAEMERIAKANEGKSIIIGTHALALRAFITIVKGIPFEKMHTELPWVSNASVTYVEYENGTFTVTYYGYDEHLKNAGLATVLRAKA